MINTIIACVLTSIFTLIFVDIFTKIRKKKAAKKDKLLTLNEERPERAKFENGAMCNKVYVQDLLCLDCSKCICPKCGANIWESLKNEEVDE